MVTTAWPSPRPGPLAGSATPSVARSAGLPTRTCAPHRPELNLEHSRSQLLHHGPYLAALDVSIRDWLCERDNIQESNFCVHGLPSYST
jgi:hypothetical protein